MDAHNLVEAPGNYTEWKKKKKVNSERLHTIGSIYRTFLK